MKKELYDQKDRLYADALRFWYASLYINFGTLVFLLVTIFISWPSLAWLFGFVTLLSPIALLGCRVIFESKFREADRCKRLLHYVDSLGIEIPEAEAACLLGYPSRKPVKITYDGPFYVSLSEQGIRRLVDNTRESAFFTFKLAGHTRNYSLAVIGLMVITVFVIFHTILSTPEDTKNIVNYAKSAAGVMSFLFTGDIIILCLKWWGMQNEAEKSYNTLNDLLKRANITVDEAMRAVEEYHIAVIQGAPIPVKVYLRHRDSLNAAYQKAHGIKGE